MTYVQTCANEHIFRPPHSTGKERDSESGNDYFGARYYASTMGRFLSPDPMMASAKVWDPQTWNRYTYGRNNPLLMIDPTGLAEVTAAQCAKDKGCVTVNVNVIWDKNSNGGKGVSPEQKAAFEKNQLQTLKDQFGNADVHFDVTYSDGAVKNGNTVTAGLMAGALNVAVSDSVGGARSGVTPGGTAISLIGANSTDRADLVTEVSHHFSGDTFGVLAHMASWLNKNDPGDGAAQGLLLAMPQMLTNVQEWIDRQTMRAVERSWTPNALRPTDFHGGAYVFQQYIQPTTSPKQ